MEVPNCLRGSKQSDNVCPSTGKILQAKNRVQSHLRLTMGTQVAACDQALQGPKNEGLKEDDAPGT